MSDPRDSTKSDRALALHEQGLESWQIAVRLSTTVNSVGAMIIAARRRRNEKSKENANE